MADSLSRIMTKVAFTPKVPLVMKATSDDPTPTPASLIHDVINITFESLDHCENLMLFLVERLNKSSVHTKSKVLHLMKSILEKGHEEFAVGLRRNADGIEKAKSFNQNEDPLHGKAFIHKVRENAQAVSELLFDVSRRTENQSGGGRKTNPASTQGFGSDIQSRGVPQSKQMQGFGHSNINQSMQGQPGFLSDAQSILKGWKETLVGAGPPSHATPSSNHKYHLHEEDNQRSNVTLPSNTFTAFNNSSKHSPNISTDGSYNGLSPTSVQQPQFTTPHSTPTLPLEQTPEYRAINDLTSTGGIKVEPNKKDIDSFISRCKTWDATKVTEALKQCLESTNSSNQIKALYVIDSITTSNSERPELKRSLKEHCYESVSNMKNSTSKTARDKSNKVLDLWSNQTQPSLQSPLNIQDSTLNNPINKMQVASNTETSLLGLFDDITSSSSSPQTIDRPHVSSSGLMQGNTNSNISTPNQPDSTADFFSGMQIHQAQPLSANGIRKEPINPSTSNKKQLDLFGLDFDSPSTSTTNQQPLLSPGLSSMSTNQSRSSNQPILPTMPTSNNFSHQPMPGSTSQIPSNSMDLDLLGLMNQTPQKISFNNVPNTPLIYHLPAGQNSPTTSNIRMSHPSPAIQGNLNSNLRSQHVGIQRTQLPSRPLLTGAQPRYSYGGNQNLSNPGFHQQFPRQSNYAPQFQPQMQPSMASMQRPNQSQDFGFIGRSSGNGDAFDFVKDAMNASKSK